MRALIFRSRSAIAVIFALILVIGLLLILYGSTGWKSLGISLVAGAVVSLSTLWIDHLRTAEQLRGAELLAAGIQQIAPRRDLVDEYEKRVSNAREIWVTGYTLRTFTESNEVRFHQRAQSGEKFEVRMLIVDPHADAAEKAESAEKVAKGSYADQFQSILQKLKGLGAHVQLRLLPRHLPMMIYRIDNALYTGPYPFIGSSRLAFTLTLHKGGWLFDRQMEEFEALWTAGTPVELPSS